MRDDVCPPCPAPEHLSSSKPSLIQHENTTVVFHSARKGAVLLLLRKFPLMTRTWGLENGSRQESYESVMAHFLVRKGCDSPAGGQQQCVSPSQDLELEEEVQPGVRSLHGPPLS